MKWDWRLFVGAVADTAADVTQSAAGLLKWVALALDEDHERRVDEREWANAVLEEINTIHTTEDTDG